ncbi:MAG: tetratricopeptide repeat protein [Proteobacteria bacterium]|nr:tetratricopeptide repeat protein [Pseudomonadota bacterium]MBU1416870.1 tetratricopeptide repeat protein [Pseudomonadota bacterium]MBU1454700.1 tetratricopeptide repeat protein [Pseudomonadota bacterium]
MTEKSGLVKKETLIYALLIGFVAGFISGAIFAVYKLKPITSSQQVSGTAATDTSSQLSNQQMEAIVNLEAEVTANKDNVEAWTRLGHLYYDTEQPTQAIKAYTQSLALQPNNADVWTDMGVMYRQNKQPDKAIESFEKAYSIQPGHEPARLNKGIVLLYDMDKPLEAIATWEELLAINPQAKLSSGMPLQQAVTEIKKELASMPRAEEQEGK